MSTHTHPARLRTTAVIALSAFVGVALAVGGNSLALWQDDAQKGTSIDSGYEYFAAAIEGDPLVPASDETAPPTDYSVGVTVGADQAEPLLEEGSVAVPFQVDSLSQGNKGLSYQLTLPTDWGDGVFGFSEVIVFPVDTSEDCTVDEAPATQPTDLKSTPVSADYADSGLTTEYWCLVAVLGDLSVGTYTNQAGVSGDSPGGETVTATDSWSTDVLADLDPDDEPDHTITFTYETFRPGPGGTP